MQKTLVTFSLTLMLKAVLQNRKIQNRKCEQKNTKTTGQIQFLAVTIKQQIKLVL